MGERILMVKGVMVQVACSAHCFAQHHLFLKKTANAQYQIGDRKVNCASSKKSSQFKVVLSRLKSGPRAEKRFCGAFRHRWEITYALLLVIASKTSLPQVHTNDVDTQINKFCNSSIFGCESDIIQFYRQSTIQGNGLSHRCIRTSNIFGNLLQNIFKSYTGFSEVLHYYHK